MANQTEKGIQALPHEGVERVSVPPNRPDLHAMALVCMKLTASANVALYKSYLNAEAPYDAPFRLFLRTVCEFSEDKTAEPLERAGIVLNVDIEGADEGMR